MASEYIAAVRHPCKQEDNTGTSSTLAGLHAGPYEDPSPPMLNMFWRRITGLTSRKHDEDGSWKGAEEVSIWNRANHTVKSYFTSINA